MRSEWHEGFTLSELLVVIAIIGIVVAAEEVGNALRFAIEGGRTGAYILVDAKTAPRRLKVVTSNATGAALGPVNDPLTKRALNIDIEGGAFSGPASMSDLSAPPSA